MAASGSQARFVRAWSRDAPPTGAAAPGSQTTLGRFFSPTLPGPREARERVRALASWDPGPAPLSRAKGVSRLVHCGRGQPREVRAPLGSFGELSHSGQGSCIIGKNAVGPSGPRPEAPAKPREPSILRLLHCTCLRVDRPSG